MLAARHDPIALQILWDIRLPRTLGAWLAGGLLGLAGAVAQGLFRNPLADPYLLGSASGASLGVAVALLLFGAIGGNMFQANQTFAQAQEVTGGEDGLLSSAGSALVFGIVLAALVGSVILGGISSGQPVVCRFAVKPTSSILTPRATVNRAGEAVDILTKGRHDPCVGIRAVPVGEAMVACVLADHFLRHRAQVGSPS